MARYIKGLKIPATHHLTLGSAYHHALEINFVSKVKTHDDLPLDVVTDAFSDEWDKRLKTDEPVFVGAKPGEVKDSGIAIVSKYHTEMAPSIQPFMVEEKFDVNVGPCAFTGVIDLVTENQVIDHKTSSRIWTQDKVDADIQATAYLMACEKLGLPVQQFEYHVAVATKEPSLQTLKTARSKRDVARYVDLLKRAATIIQSGTFMDASPDAWWCGPKYCGYYKLCKA